MRPDYSLLFALAAVGLVFGCQQAPAPVRPAQSPSVSPAVVARGEGDQAMERAEYAKAAATYQDAVTLDPNDMALRFALGGERLCDRRTDALRRARDDGDLACKFAHGSLLRDFKATERPGSGAPVWFSSRVVRDLRTIERAFYSKMG